MRLMGASDRAEPTERAESHAASVRGALGTGTENYTGR